MKVFIVLSESGEYTPLITVEKVFLNENQAYNFADEQNSKHHHFYFYVEEKEVE